MMRLFVSGIKYCLRTSLIFLGACFLSLGWMVSVTVEPSAPLMRLTLVWMAASLVDWPSTTWMMSPGTRPAAFAGDPANTAEMTRPSLVFCSDAPMPPEWSPSASRRSPAPLSG